MIIRINSQETKIEIEDHDLNSILIYAINRIDDKLKEIKEKRIGDVISCGVRLAGLDEVTISNLVEDIRHLNTLRETTSKLAENIKSITSRTNHSVGPTQK